MKGQELKEARLQKGWTQQQAAERLGVTQAYLSMLEHGVRALPHGLARKAAQTLQAPPTTLPLRTETFAALLSSADRARVSERLRAELAALGYPGFAHVRGSAQHNPAEVLLSALNASELDSRVVEGLPWLVLRYADMDWDWLVPNAKLLDRQNRLGFVTALASPLAVKSNDPKRFQRLQEYAGILDRSRLAREDTLCHDSLTEAERNWLRRNRPAEAEHWNLLTDMKAENLPHATG